jgi:dCTP deaminase
MSQNGLSSNNAHQDPPTAPRDAAISGAFLTDAEVVFALYSGSITITPIFSAEQLGPTVDLRLGTEFIVKKMDKLSFFDILRFNEMSNVAGNDIERYYERVRVIDPGEPFVLHPGQFALGSTLEYIELQANIGAQLEGRSSWAREGLNVHSTAGLIHPGHRGVIVFELQNLGTHPLPLYAGTRVAQLLFYRLPNMLKRPYSSNNRYFGMTETRYGAPWKDWEYERLRKAALSSSTNDFNRRRRR